MLAILSVQEAFLAKETFYQKPLAVAVQDRNTTFQAKKDLADHALRDLKHISCLADKPDQHLWTYLLLGLTILIGKALCDGC